MTINLTSARQFIYANARVLDRHRIATVLDGSPPDPALAALRAYRNPDGGFGHALEPDVRCPGSQTAATLQALEVLTDIGAPHDVMVQEAAEWLAMVSEPDGGVRTVLPAAAGYPRAPWMEPSEGSGFLTYALAARLWQAGSTHPWLARATEWCWTQLEDGGHEPGYTVKFAVDFLDAVPDPRRAAAALERLRPALDPDGSMAVPGGTDDERLRPLDISPVPGLPSRALFDDKQIDADLDRLEAGQHDDGGWDVDFLHWSPGQALEWRGLATVLALVQLRDNGRLES